jgi:hypothetical protein
MHTTEISYPFQTKSFKQLVIQSKKMLQTSQRVDFEEDIMGVFKKPSHL